MYMHARAKDELALNGRTLFINTGNSSAFPNNSRLRELESSFNIISKSLFIDCNPLSYPSSVQNDLYPTGLYLPKNSDILSDK